jgi:hypothetical protein
MSGKVVHSLTDMNGDGVADLVVFSLKGGEDGWFGQVSQMWDMQSSYEVHFSSVTAGAGTFFAPEVSTAIDSD